MRPTNSFLPLTVFAVHLAVTVADLPRVLSQHGRRFLARGMPARLECPVDANPPVTEVRWTKNGRAMPLGALNDRSQPWQVKLTFVKFIFSA